MPTLNQLTPFGRRRPQWTSHPPCRRRCLFWTSQHHLGGTFRRIFKSGSVNTIQSTPTLDPPFRKTHPFWTNHEGEDIHSGPVIHYPGGDIHSGPVIYHPGGDARSGPVIYHPGGDARSEPVIYHPGGDNHSGPVIYHPGGDNHSGPVIYHSGDNHFGPIIYHAGGDVRSRPAIHPSGGDARSEPVIHHPFWTSNPPSRRRTTLEAAIHYSGLGDAHSGRFIYRPEVMPTLDPSFIIQEQMSTRHPPSSRRCPH